MTDPDIEHQNWKQQSVWTTRAWRAQILSFVRTFVKEHNWALSWSVVEGFQDNGIQKRVPLGPTGPRREPRTLEEGFLERSGTPYLVLGMNTRQGSTVDVGIMFPRGVNQHQTTIDAHLSFAQLSLEAGWRRAAGL